MAPALTALESQGNSKKILFSDHQETNRSNRVEENNATDDNFANNKANNNAIDDYNNDQVMVEFIKVGHIWCQNQPWNRPRSQSIKSTL